MEVPSLQSGFRFIFARAQLFKGIATGVLSLSTKFWSTIFFSIAKGSLADF